MMIRSKTICLTAISLCLFASVVSSQTERTGQWTLTPFWKSGTMEGESVLFVRERDGAHAKAPLLFTPSRIVSVISADGRTVYEEDSGRLDLLGRRLWWFDVIDDP